MRKKRFSWLALFLAGLALVASFLFPGLGDEKTAGVDVLTVKVLYVGQGDAILLRSGKDTVLVDSGVPDERQRLVAMLKQEGIKKIDLLVATHPHGDHIGGMDALLEAFPVKKVLDSGQVHTSKMFTNYLNTIKKKGIPFSKVAVGERYQLDDGAYLEVLWPAEPFIKGTSSDLNNNSMVLRLVKGDFSMLLTGDIQKEAEAMLVRQQGNRLKSTILKSPHHASVTSSSKDFLSAVNAEAVVVSCGKNNDYGFPNDAVVKRYKAAKMKMYVTSSDGNITIKSDGKGYNVTTGG